MKRTAGPAQRPGGRGPRIALGVAAVSAVLFVLLAVLVGLRHGAPYALDRSWHLWSVRHRPGAAVTFVRGLTATGTGPFPYLFALAAGLIAGRGSRGRLLASAGALAFLVLAQATRYGVLHLVHRARPDSADWAAPAANFSFPSGHSSTSALAAGLLAWALVQRARPAVARTGCVLLACWAVSVGLSRVYLGVHWPSDVLGGWLYALAWLGLGWAVAPRLLATPVPPDITPTRDSGGIR